jgi:NAD-dependent DNA ligase
MSTFTVPSKNTIQQINQEPGELIKNLTEDQLGNILKYLSHMYYNASPVVSDEIFDLLKEALKKRNSKHPVLKEIGAPIVNKKEMVKLPYFMPSLDKIKPDTNEILTWTQKYKGPYILTDKLDGVSALIHKNDKGEVKMYTRGDGTVGQDISYLLKHTVSKNVDFSNIPNNTAIRGELIMKKKTFEDNHSDKMANARNLVAGLVNSKKLRLKAAKDTTFVAYSMVYPRYKHQDQLQKLQDMNFDVVHMKTRKKIDNDYMSDYLVKRRDKGKYNIDGIVVMDGSKVYDVPKDALPDHAFAFKTVLTDQVAEATVVDVLWEASKDGYLKPRIQIEPVNLVGVTITFATGFNGKFIKDNKIGPGSVVKIVRSGDVIPHIMEVTKSTKAKMPKGDYEWTDTGVDIIVGKHGEHKDTILTKKITYFFNTLGVKFISEKLVGKLVENGYKSVKAIVEAEMDELEKIDGIGKTLMKKVMANLEKAIKNTNLATFMAASQAFGRGFAIKRLKMVLKEYPDILTVNWDDKKMLDKILSIEGFQSTTATQFIKGLKKYKKFHNDIKGVLDIVHLTKVKKTETKKKKKKKGSFSFEGENVVFTGFRNKEWEEIVENDGGKVSGTVSSKTTILVYDDEAKNATSSSKFVKAQGLKINILTKKNFQQLLIT